MDLKGRDFLTLKDFTAEEIIYLVDLAAERLIWILQVLRSAKKRASATPHAYWAECSKVSSIVDLDRKLWKNWQNMQGFRYGTA